MIDFLKRLYDDAFVITQDEHLIVRIDYYPSLEGGTPQLMIIAGGRIYSILLDETDAMDAKLHDYCINWLKSEMARLASEPQDLEVQPHNCE